MTHQEILQKAMLKATKNEPGSEEAVQKFVEIIASMEADMPIVAAAVKAGFIFDHDFAKGFWGENDLDIDYCLKENINPFPMLEEWDASSIKYIGKVWQYHLQQMVLEEDPIKYLEKFL